jgi:hypothetical protein
MPVRSAPNSCVWRRRRGPPASLARSILARLADRLVHRPARRTQGRRAALALGLTADVLMVQTSDPHVYFDMLCVSARTNRAYCRRHGIAYQAFIGVKRGFHPWQATFNRIPLLHELAQAGFAGWVLYLDADAYVADLAFDLRAYLADKADRAAILVPVASDVPWWDVNAGVALFNLASAEGRWLVERWRDAFAAIGDDALRAAGRWDLVRNDQDLLHDILRGNDWLRPHVFLQGADLINSHRARFIRQVLRVQADGLAARMRVVSDDADRILAADAVAEAEAAGQPT